MHINKIPGTYYIGEQPGEMPIAIIDDTRQRNKTAGRYVRFRYKMGYFSSFCVDNYDRN